MWITQIEKKKKVEDYDSFAVIFVTTIPLSVVKIEKQVLILSDLDSET